jgi:branched-chain amino acid transport system ATP-binding protein
MPASAPTVLSAEGVTVRFGGLSALTDVSLTVPAGEIVGLIGPNGAGKTTMFNVLTGLQGVRDGRVLYRGTDISRWPPHRRGRAGIARTFQRLALFTRMTVHDNLVAAWESSHPAGVLGRGRAERRRRVQEVMDLVGLGPVAERVAGELSTGRGRMVELGRALCADPALLLLDEPGSGLDPRETAVFSDVLRTVVLGDAGPAVLLVEHDMSLVMNVCSYIYVLDFGRLVFDGDPSSVAASPVVQAAYLGTEAVVGAAAGSGDR